MVTENNSNNIYTENNSPYEAESQDYQQQINSVTAAGPYEKQDGRQGILLNVDSTLLKLDDSGLDTESIQDMRAPIELAMQIHRMNETENETA